jgi:hypothetical protein
LLGRDSRELRPSNQYILSEGETELLPFSEDMVVPGEFSVQVES